NYTKVTDPKQCHCQSKASLTLQQVTGQDLYIGSVPPEKQALCNKTLALPNTHNYVWWACFTGLMPCTHIQVLNNTMGFCVMVELVARLIYHTEKELFNKLETEFSELIKREPMVAFTL
ncbi:envelope glycoprotein, partial [Sigmodon hispidus]